MGWEMGFEGVGVAHPRAGGGGRYNKHNREEEYRGMKHAFGLRCV